MSFKLKFSTQIRSSSCSARWQHCWQAGWSFRLCAVRMLRWWVHFWPDGSRPSLSFWWRAPWCSLSLRDTYKVEAHHCCSSVFFLRRQKSSQREVYDDVWGDVKTVALTSCSQQSNSSVLLTLIVAIVIVLHGVMKQPCIKLNRTS